MATFSTDCIVAIATAPGRGGIGVVRVSGSNLETFIQRLFGRSLQPRHAYYLPFHDAAGVAIDAGIALYFKTPHSYTGEDVLELQGHGGPAVLKCLLDRCLEVGRSLGLRLAQPGEFTQRAYLHDRIDLAQAEAVADLIDASSQAAARSAMASLSGAFSDQINALSDRVVHVRMLVEATLDFPEEEIDFLQKYQVRDLLDAIRDDLDVMVRQAKQGGVLREGLHVVLAGQPNVGKSSLLNALAGDDVAIVTPIAGTTRDRVIQQIHISGVPLHIVDTAGLRDTDDAVESIGIARSWAEIQKADVVLHIQDAREAKDALDTGIAKRLPVHTPVLDILNKADLLEDKIEKKTSFDRIGHSAESLVISAKTGAGLDVLRSRLLAIAGWSPGTESPWLARERHLHALQAAREHVLLADGHAGNSDKSLDLFAEELRLAHNDLCAITGEFSSDDLLGEIFAGFCIGK